MRQSVLATPRKQYFYPVVHTYENSKQHKSYSVSELISSIHQALLIEHFHTISLMTMRDNVMQKVIIKIARIVVVPLLDA